MRSNCHPLYEDVNWNAVINPRCQPSWVILYMRMWIEIRNSDYEKNCQGVILYMRMWIEISILLHNLQPPESHPLYEDVNWNASCNSLLLSAAVILYMRMWIEIRQFQIYISHQVVILYMRMWIEILPVVTAWYLSRVILYMRMWIEIFHQSIYTQPILVILYMRMWIEMIQNPEILQIGDASSSIWGCELKYGVFLSWYHIHIGHPLYEDVNWNSTEVFANDPYFRHPLYEDVNWNTLVVHEKSL